MTQRIKINEALDTETILVGASVHCCFCMPFIGICDNEKNNNHLHLTFV